MVSPRYFNHFQSIYWVVTSPLPAPARRWRSSPAVEPAPGSVTSIGFDLCKTSSSFKSSSQTLDEHTIMPLKQTHSVRMRSSKFEESLESPWHHLFHLDDLRGSPQLRRLLRRHPLQLVRGQIVGLGPSGDRSSMLLPKDDWKSQVSVLIILKH